MAKQTLKQALHLLTSGKSDALVRAAFALDNIPAGDWPDTQEARRRMIDDLPMRHARAYTADEFADAVYDWSELTGRYRTRSMATIRERAGGLKARIARVVPMRRTAPESETQHTRQCEERTEVRFCSGESITGAENPPRRGWHVFRSYYDPDRHMWSPWAPDRAAYSTRASALKSV
jgi:hypothetical protein